MADKKTAEKAPQNGFEARLMWQPGQVEITPPKKSDTPSLDKLKRKVVSSG